VLLAVGSLLVVSSDKKLFIPVAIPVIPIDADLSSKSNPKGWYINSIILVVSNNLN
jgi:hypothetical protein